MNSMLLEIGVEEIPGSYIEPAVNVFSTNLSKQLSMIRIDHGLVETFSTPRRLAVLIKDVAQKQKDNKKRVYGPSEKIALDSKGGFSLPAIKFAKKVGVSLNELEITATKKGRYISVEKIELGQKTDVLLKTILPAAILEIPFPKNMRWSNLHIRFARPIRTIVALFGKTVIEFEIAGSIKSSANSTGHPFMSTGNVIISNPDNYVATMKRVNVIADNEERYNITYKIINKAASSIGGKVLDDSALISIVNNLVEFPVAVVGSFDKLFLDLPKEILVNTMREQQRFFSVVDFNDQLLPNFVAVSNTLARDMSLIIIGYERVLRARLSDAKFFYDSDRIQSLDSWVNNLNGVLFHAKLGSMYEKVLRLRKIVEHLMSLMIISVDKKKVIRAVYLCKADLVSQVVIEFPKLQGVMGSIYASLAGESEEVALAIEEHYWPIKSGGKLPITKIGTLVAVADKVDSICGCFSIGLVPTGTTDPYSLRRHAIGLLRIIRDASFKVSLKSIVKNGLDQYHIKDRNKLEVLIQKICKFLLNRFVRLLLDNGYSEDIIKSVISVSFDNIIDIERRIDAVEGFSKAKIFSIVRVYKRIDNILLKSEFTQSEISEKLFQDDSELFLYKVYLDTNNKIESLIVNYDVKEALEIMALLCEPVDLFFDHVLVMAEDYNICQNRLALISAVSKVFRKIADFSQISVYLEV